MLQRNKTRLNESVLDIVFNKVGKGHRFVEHQADGPNEKSPGHICFAGNYEFYEAAGEVYKADRSNVFDTQTGYRIGRWECSKAHFDRYRSMITGE